MSDKELIERLEELSSDVEQTKSELEACTGESLRSHKHRSHQWAVDVRNLELVKHADALISALRENEKRGEALGAVAHAGEVMAAPIDTEACNYYAQMASEMAGIARNALKGETDNG